MTTRKGPAETIGRMLRTAAMFFGGMTSFSTLVSEHRFRTSEWSFESAYFVEIARSLSALISRRTVQPGHRYIVQPQVDAQLRTVVDDVIHHEAPENGNSRFC